MKFGQTLRDSQVVEWKDAYFDYFHAKKLIKQARQSRAILLSEPELSHSSSLALPTLHLNNDRDRQPPVLQASHKESAFRLKRPQLTLRISSTKNSILLPSKALPKLRFSQHAALEDIWDRLSEQERNVFMFLDSELDKTDEFFCKQETTAIKRFHDLKQQLDRLLEHREHLQKKPLACDDKCESQGKPSNTPAARDHSILHVTHRLLHPHEYIEARRSLKSAFVELYQLLEYLHSYQILNQTGFSKATKKFTKHTGIPTTLQWMPKLNNAHFVISEVPQELLLATEVLFTRNFAQGNRKKALQRLQASEKTAHSYYNSVSYSFLLIGLSLPPLGDGIRRIFEDKRSLPFLPALLQIYGCLFLPVFMGLMVSSNVIIWKRARIHYTLIFGFNQRTVVHYRKLVELPATLLFLLSYCFWLSLSVTAVKPYIWPIVFLCIALFLLINPLQLYNRSSRGWLLRTLGRVSLLGGLPVEFRDFFILSDIISLEYSLYVLPYFWCAYHHRWVPDVHEICAINHWSKPAIASIPSVMILGHYLRRYYDTRRLLNLGNFGKMSTSVITIYLFYDWRSSGGHRDLHFYVWIISAIVNSTYLTAWDIIIDWNLLNRNPKHWMLRKRIAYPPWFYYFAIVLDALGRFHWVIWLNSRFPKYAPVKSFAAGLIEAMRRALLWNVIRVENEHQGNTDAYRATRDIPLPYTSNNDHENTIAKSIDAEEAAKDKETLTTGQRTLTFLNKFDLGTRTRRRHKVAKPAGQVSRTGGGDEEEAMAELVHLQK